MSDGVLALYRGVSITSGLIRLRTWSQYSHAAYIDPKGGVYEAWRPRVRYCVDYHHGHTPGTVIDCYSVDWSAKQERAVRAVLAGQIGKPYDLRGCLGFFSRRDGAQSQDRWFCSELLVWASRQVQGAEILARRPAWRIAPGDLEMATRLRLVGSLVCGDAAEVGFLVAGLSVQAICAANQLRQRQDAPRAGAGAERADTRARGDRPVCNAPGPVCNGFGAPRLEKPHSDTGRC